MRARDCLRMAWSSVRRRAVRSVLCVLAVAVGTGALTLILSLGLFGRQAVANGVRSLGVSGLTVYLDEKTGNHPLSASVAAAMAEDLDGVAAVLPLRAQACTVRAGYQRASAVAVGAGEALGRVMQLDLVAGHLPSAWQNAFGARVAVVEDTMAHGLFRRENIVGQQLLLQIDGVEERYTVIGVARAQTGAFGGLLNAVAPHLIYVPYRCFAQDSEPTDQVFVQCAGDASPETVGAEIETYLTKRQQIGGTVRVQNLTGIVQTVLEMTDTCTRLFYLIGAIALLVALLGVSSNMLAAAHEQTAEIGVFLALGARRRDVLGLFLLQAVLLCGVGGAIGIAGAALLLSFGASLLLPSAVYLAASLLLSLGCGVLAGFVPALRAARLDPVVAMHQ